jgi:hypothetical protein
MIYITGDTHGDQDRWQRLIAPTLAPGDILIICGDFGVGFWNGRCWSEETFYDHLSQQPYTVLFVDGNHENFDQLNGYPVEAYCGGKVHRLRPNLLHLMRGEVYTIEGNTFFVMGGGYSLDKAMRVEGESWWREEMPSQEEYQNARSNLERAGFRVDYILTHTAPSETVYYLSTLRSFGIKRTIVEELPLTTFLDEVRSKVTYQHWYFGHFHVDAELWRNQTAILDCVRAVQTVRTYTPF